MDGTSTSTVKLRTTTILRLRNRGRSGDTIEQIVGRLLDATEPGARA